MVTHNILIEALTFSGRKLLQKVERFTCGGGLILAAGQVKFLPPWCQPGLYWVPYICYTPTTRRLTI